MPTITVPSLDAIQIEYKQALESYDELEVKLDQVLDNLNYGPDLNDEGDKFLNDLLNLRAIITSVGRFLPDEIPNDIFTE